jgi:VWFA-related protein
VTLVGGTLLALAASGAGAQQPVFRSGLDLVTARATALDRRGGFITDLTADDFEIYEDGKKQTIKYFAPCDAQEHDPNLPSPELHLGVLLDISGSMEEDLKLARTAAIKFLNTLVDAVDITLVDFDTEVRVALYAQNDFPRLVERVRTRKAEGYTALYDAIGVYLDGAGSQRGRKVLVLYTDGGDNASNITFSELLSLLKASDVTVYSIGFLEHQLISTKMEQRMQLQQIAEVTGGQFLLPTSIKELESAYEKVRQEIAAQYTLGYVSTNERTDGAWRKIEIKVTRPDLKDVRIRARKGYFGPYKPTGHVSRRDGPRATF